MAVTITEQRRQQELTDTARGNTPTYLPSSPSKKYNQLACSCLLLPNKHECIMLALAMLIAINMYRLYLTSFGSTTSITVLTLQSILLFLPAAWFALHILFFMKKQWSAFRRWFTRLQQSRRRNGRVYDRVPENDEHDSDTVNEENS